MTTSKEESNQDSNISQSNDLRKTGLFKDYLLGLDHIRKIVMSLEIEMSNHLALFYRVQTVTDEEKCNQECLKFDAYFRDCNELLQRHGKKRLHVDGQVVIANLINDVRYCEERPADSKTFEELSAYWERLKLTVECLQTVRDKFEAKVVFPLEAICFNLNQTEEYSHNEDVIKTYGGEITEYKDQITIIQNSFRLLAASSGNHIKVQYLERSALMDRLLKGCDILGHSLLRLVPDMTSKLENLFRIAKQWMDRDEKFLLDIGHEIRDTKIKTRSKEAEMEKKKEKRRELIKSVKASFLMCQNSKRKLRELTGELESLESRVQESRRESNIMTDEKTRAEIDAEFLHFSSLKTRKNQMLLLKRQKLLRKVKELETNLNHINDHIQDLKQEINEISSQQKDAQDTHDKNERHFNQMRQDLDGCTMSLREVHKELDQLYSTINQLQSVQVVKISAENIDNFFSEEAAAPPIKLSSSLKEKIIQKKRKYMEGLSGSSHI